MTVRMIINFWVMMNLVHIVDMFAKEFQCPQIYNASQLRSAVFFASYELSHNM